MTRSRNVRGTVLVTGGTGLIGSSVTRALRERQFDVVVLDLRPRRERLTGLDKVSIIAGDLRDRGVVDDILDKHRVTHVIHLAAVLSLDAAREPARAVEVNAVGTLQLFDTALRHGLDRVVWASTTGQYGSPQDYERLLGRARVDENDPVMPRNLYAATKQLIEVAAAGYRSRGLDVVGLRPVLTYGNDDTPTAAGIVNQALRDLALHGHARLADPWARETRINVMHADDCADLFVGLLTATEPMRHAIYNAGTGEYASLGALFDEISAIGRVEFASASTDGPGAAGIPIYDFPDVDSTRVRSELNWRGRHTFGTGALAVIGQFRAKALDESTGAHATYQEHRQSST